MEFSSCRKMKPIFRSSFATGARSASAAVVRQHRHTTSASSRDANFFMVKSSSIRWVKTVQPSAKKRTFSGKHDPLYTNLTQKSSLFQKKSDFFANNLGECSEIGGLAGNVTFLTSISAFRIRLQRKHTVSIAADSMCRQHMIGKGSFKFHGNLAKTPLTLHCP